MFNTYWAFLTQQPAQCQTYHLVLLSDWLSDPVCRRGNSPDRRLMGLLDWFLAVAAGTGGCKKQTAHVQRAELHPGNSRDQTCY